MYTDALLKVASDQDFNGALDTPEVSASSIDLKAPGTDVGSPDLGILGKIVAQAIVKTAVTNCTTVKMEVIVSASAALTSPTVIGSTDAIPRATFNAEGAICRINPNVEISDLTADSFRYLGVQITASGGSQSGTNAIDVYFVELANMPQRLYPSRFVGSKG